MTTQALGDTLAVHRRFKEHYQLNGAAAAAVQRNRIKERRQPNSAAPAADPQSETFMPHAVDSPQNNLATPTTAAVTADLNVQMGQSLPRARPFDDVQKARAAEVNGTDAAFDDNQVHDVTSPHGAAAAAVQRNRIKERRQPNSAAPAADPQSETFMPHAVDSPQNNLATPTTAAVTADLNVQMGQSLPRARPFDDVHKARAAEVNRTMIDFKSRSCLRAEQFELEEIVVQAAIPPVMTELGMLDSNAADAVSAASLMRRAK